MKAVLLMMLLSGYLLNSAELLLPAPALERDQQIAVIFKTGLQATGKGTLKIRWSDSYGRLVEDRSLAVELIDEKQILFPLDLRRAVAMQNDLTVHFSFEGVNKKGEKDHREEDAAVRFIAKPREDGWRDYNIIMWQAGTQQHFKELESVGVNAGKSNEHSMAIPGFLLNNNLPWYVENMATDFYSAYHIFRPDRPYNYALLQAKEQYSANLSGANLSSRDGLKRNPSFEDPEWISTIHDRLVAYARTYSPYRPLFYNLADESGIAELAGFWDFDFSDHSLAAMRTWLKSHYGTLNALNQQWATKFSAWDDVTPDTTLEAMKRTDDNFSSWADFKEWMDISFANALKRGADAVHSVDPSALVGIEGAQMPGWGGYDYYRLSSVLQAMEPYDIGNNVEIVRSLNPQLAFVTTAFAQGPWEKQRLWYELLHGARGNIIWDEKDDIILPDGKLGPRGEDVAESWRELRGGIGALLINSVRQADPIAIHYSQASMRTEWMLHHRNSGDAWLNRLSFNERKDSDFLALRNSYCHLIEDQGLQYNFVAYGQVEQGELLKRGYRVLILPHSSSLSLSEASAIQSFVQQGGTLVVDGDAGTFDEHSRKLAQSSLAELFAGHTGSGAVVRMNALRYGEQRILNTEGETLAAMRKVLSAVQVKPVFSVTSAQGEPVVGVETHTFQNGSVSIVGLLSNPQMETDDLGEPDADASLKSRARFEKPVTVRLAAPTELYAYDLRASKALGRLRQVTVTVMPYEPVLIAFSPTPLPALRLAAPLRVARGEVAQIGMSLDGPGAAANSVFHLDVRDPSGQLVDYYSGNIQASSGAAAKLLPMALNAAEGRWSVAVKDLLSGQHAEAAIEVF